jgi:D-3-phosphoglycerate dehydrogenase
MTAFAQCRELRGATLGIIGYGAIGRRTGEIASAGFGMNLLAHTSTPSKLPPQTEGVSLEALFARSDFILVSCPLTASTRGMVDAALLAYATRHPVLINVSRGPVLCEDDVVAALKDGTLRGAVLDVYDQHPLPADSPLRAAPNVLLTPHIAGLTQDAARSMGFAAVRTMLAMLRGERPANIVNSDYFAVKKETLE